MICDVGISLTTIFDAAALFESGAMLMDAHLWGGMHSHVDQRIACLSFFRIVRFNVPR